MNTRNDQIVPYFSCRRVLLTAYISLNADCSAGKLWIVEYQIAFFWYDLTRNQNQIFGLRDRHSNHFTIASTGPTNFLFNKIAR